MSERPSIFRSDALRRYAAGQAVPVLPRFVMPRALIWLWLLIGLFGGVSVIAWFAQVPVYVSGTALLVPEAGTSPGAGQPLVVALLPPDSRLEIQAGQPILVRLPGTGDTIRRSIDAVAPQASSPAEVAQRYQLVAGTAAAVTGPTLVATAQLSPVPGGLSPSTYAGAVGQVDVEVGSRRVISFLPLAGRVLGG